MVVLDVDMVLLEIGETGVVRQIVPGHLGIVVKPKVYGNTLLLLHNHVTIMVLFMIKVRQVVMNPMVVVVLVIVHNQHVSPLLHQVGQI